MILTLHLTFFLAYIPTYSDILSDILDLELAGLGRSPCMRAMRAQAELARFLLSGKSICSDIPFGLFVIRILSGSLSGIQSDILSVILCGIFWRHPVWHLLRHFILAGSYVFPGMFRSVCAEPDLDHTGRRSPTFHQHLETLPWQVGNNMSKSNSLEYHPPNKHRPSEQYASNPISRVYGSSHPVNCKIKWIIEFP